tara:strand:- start:658 stop:1602 length:945 start_codon:yes stop_codon:yes gene_type:complete
MRKLRFDLNILPSAELTPNADAFYAQAYLGGSEIADNFRSLPGIKYKTKIGTVTFGSGLLATSPCNFPNLNTDDLSSHEVDVCALSAMAQVCQFDLEQSFVSLQMAAGSNGDFTVASFFSFYWSEMANAIAGQIEELRWKGDILSVNPQLALCDGYEKQLAASELAGDVINGGGGAITTFSGVGGLGAKLEAAFALVPAAIASRTADLRIYMPTQLVNIYRLGVASGNTNAYITQDLSLTYLGIKIVLCPGMSNNKFVITLKDNLIYAFDGEGDASDLRAVNLADTVAEPVIRTRANMKVGFSFVNPTDIVYYA